MNYDSYTSMNFNISRVFDQGPRGVRLIEGPLGPGLAYDNYVIHNETDPRAEAAAWLDQAAADLKSAPGLALVFGLGLGYHLAELSRRYPGIRLVVFEPIAEMIEPFEQAGVFTAPEEAPLQVFTDWSEFEKGVGREVVYGDKSGVLVLAPEGYRAVKPEAFGAFNIFTHQEIIRRSVIERTRENTGQAFLSNLAQNAGRLLNLPDLLVLKGRLPARAAFLVGSGPSLDKNADLLRSVGAKGLIMAPSSALKPLLSKGVRPDVVLVLESEDTSDYLRLTPAEREVLGDNTVLALASGCHPAHFEVDGFHQAIFHLTGGEAQTFSHGVFLPQGGNSGSAVFALAYVWGLNPLVLVAQDQAYEQGRLHAEGTPGDVAEVDPSTISVLGVGGEVVETNTGLLASLGWYAEAARTIAAQDSPPQLYNCTASGARIPGFNEVPLSAVVSSLPPVNNRIDLAAVLPRLPRPDQAEVKGDVAQLASLITTLRRLALKNYKEAYKEIREIGKVSKFLGQVLAEAAVASSRSELLEALNKADGLMTEMMTALMEV